MKKNETNVGKPIMSASIKSTVEKVHMRLICTYEGCGADDGWPL